MPLASEFHLLDRKGRLLPVRARRCRVLGHQFKLATTSSAPDPVAVPIGEGDRPRSLPRRRQVVVRNSAPLSAVPPNRTIYVGGPDVSTQQGYPLDPGQSLSLGARSSLQVYAIKAESPFGTITTNTLELS